VTTFDCSRHAYYPFGAPFLASSGSAWTFCAALCPTGREPVAGRHIGGVVFIARTLQAGQSMFQLTELECP